MLELWERDEAEWDKISIEVAQNLIESMGGRIETILNPKDSHIKH